ncbi:MAG TPA: universal stress protein [Micromonosporaceae bacterium]
MTSSEPAAPVVVGTDGSECSLAAVALAARMAAERHRTLRVVHAFIWPELRVPLGPPPSGPPDSGLANQADEIMADAVAAANKAEPELNVTGEVVDGAPAPVLLREARNATMVVLGDRGLGGFTGLLVGSVAVQLAAHAPCPVVVYRGEPAPGRGILIGVDGSQQSDAALAFAFEEAALRGVELTALHAYTHPVSAGPGDMLPLVYDADQLESEETALLNEALREHRTRYPQVPVQARVVRDRASRALTRASQEASLVVVGSRGRGGFAGLLLGSVSQAVLHHAACPVAIVR